MYDSATSFKARLGMFAGKMKVNGTWQKLGKAARRGAVVGAIGSFVGYEVASHIGDAADAIHSAVEHAQHAKLPGLESFEHLIQGDHAVAAAQTAAEHGDQVAHMDHNVWNTVREWFQAHGVDHPTNKMINDGMHMIAEQNHVDIVGQNAHVAGHFVDTHMLQGTELHHMESLEKLLPGHHAEAAASGAMNYFENNPQVSWMTVGEVTIAGGVLAGGAILGRQIAKEKRQTRNNGGVINATGHGVVNATVAPGAAPQPASPEQAAPANAATNTPEAPRTLEQEAAEFKVDVNAYKELMAVDSGPLYELIQIMDLRQGDVRNLQREIKEAYEYGDPSMLSEVFLFLRNDLGDSVPYVEVAKAVRKFASTISKLDKSFFGRMVMDSKVSMKDGTEYYKMPKWLYRELMGLPPEQNQPENQPHSEQQSLPQEQQGDEQVEDQSQSPENQSQPQTQAQPEQQPEAGRWNVFDQTKLDNFIATFQPDNPEYILAMRNWIRDLTMGQKVKRNVNNIMTRVDAVIRRHPDIDKNAVTSLIKAVNAINPEAIGPIILEKQIASHGPDWFKQIKP